MKKIVILTLLILLLSSLTIFKGDNSSRPVELNTLTIGDSVTEGMNDQGIWVGNYIYNINNKLVKHGFKMVNFGSQTNGDSTQTGPLSDGYGGFCLNSKPGECVSDKTPEEEHSLAANFEKYIKNGKNINLVLLQGGINDINSKRNGYTGSPSYAAILAIEKMHKLLPKAKIGFFSIERLNSTDEDGISISKFNSELIKYIKKNKYTFFVDNRDINKQEYYLDDLHPNKLGYQKMEEHLVDSLVKNMGNK